MTGKRFWSQIVAGLFSVAMGSFTFELNAQTKTPVTNKELVKATDFKRNTKSAPLVTKVKDGSLSERIIGGVNTSGYANVGAVVGYSNGNIIPLGTGTLVKGRWMLTAAHVIEACEENGGNVGFYVNGAIYWSNGWAKHPYYGRIGVNGLPLGDIAIVRLGVMVPATIRPASLQLTPVGVGNTMTIVGYGSHGTGAAGAVPHSGGWTKRVGAVRVDLVASDWAIWRFDQGERYSTAPGDSGGPAFNSRGEIVSITTGGNNQGNGQVIFQDGKWISHKQGWGNWCWNTRCDVHAAWIRSLIAQFDY